MSDGPCILAATRPRRPGVQWLLICACLALVACGKQDWRAQAIARAESKIRADLSDPTATFSRVQLTGDNSTGQTCGFVSAKDASGARRPTERFIVYIDGSRGPFVEGGLGQTPISREDFSRAWQADCLSEGYNS